MQNPYFFFDNPLIVNELMKQGIDVEQLKKDDASLEDMLKNGLQELVDNGTIAQLINDVINPNDIVLIGDSYTAHNYYQQYLEPFFDNIYTFAHSGSGLSRYYDGISFLELVSQAITTLTEDQKKRVKHIVIYGGVNDIRNNTDIGIASANLETMLNNLVSNFMNAKIHLIPMNIDKTRSTASDTFANYFNVWVNATYNNPRAILHDGAYGWLKSDLGLYNSDGLHPTTKGNKVIAQNIVQCIYGADQTNFKPFKYDITNITGVSGSIIGHIKNGFLYIDRFPIELTLAEAPPSNKIVITNDDFPVYFSQSIEVPIILYQYTVGWLVFTGNNIILYIEPDYINRTVYTSATSLLIGH